MGKCFERESRTVLLMDMLDKAHARCTLGQCGFSPLLVILCYPKYQHWESLRFKYFCALILGIEKVGPREGRRPALCHIVSSSTAPIFRTGLKSTKQILNQPTLW